MNGSQPLNIHTIGPVAFEVLVHPTKGVGIKEGGGGPKKKKKIWLGVGICADFIGQTEWGRWKKPAEMTRCELAHQTPEARMILIITRSFFLCLLLAVQFAGRQANKQTPEGG